MFKNTPTLGTKTFKGQKQRVVDALLSSPESKTLDQVVALVNKDGAYDKLINDWAREKAGGVRGSVRYHLRALKKFGMVTEIPDASPIPASSSSFTQPCTGSSASETAVPVTIPVVKPGCGLDLGIGGRMGSQLQGKILTKPYPWKLIVNRSTKSSKMLVFRCSRIFGLNGADPAGWWRPRWRAAADMAGQAIVVKVDTEHHPELAARFNVRGIPNFVIFSAGRPVMQQAGAVNHEQIENWSQSADQHSRLIQGQLLSFSSVLSSVLLPKSYTPLRPKVRTVFEGGAGWMVEVTLY